VSVPAGAFVISLDFELHWGVCDALTVDAYRENLLGAREVIPRILALFEEFGIHATWATVGFLFFGRREDLVAALPARRPTYADPRVSSYNHIDSVGFDESADPFHFGSTLLERIRRVPHQEIATHTFSHFYCMEPGPTPDDFRADLIACVSAARAIGVELSSIVFPRNQVTGTCLDVCAELGIVVYRGTERAWPYRPVPRNRQGRLRRALRLADGYVNLLGYHVTPYAQTVERGMVNIPASRFLRPYSRRLRWLEWLNEQRITRAMSHAARSGAIYHLWWHPHNFGRDSDNNLASLRRILEHYGGLAARHGMRSRTMGELGAELHGAVWSDAPHSFA
jgi:peptidoglycan/xylan/chitin deacetylase (PgdA/CDA1 family)